MRFNFWDHLWMTLLYLAVLSLLVFGLSFLFSEHVPASYYVIDRIYGAADSSKPNVCVFANLPFWADEQTVCYENVFDDGPACVAPSFTHPDESEQQ